MRYYLYDRFLHPLLRFRRFERWLSIVQRSTWFLRFSCLFVLVVSVHDATLIVVNHEVMGEVERNPMGRWLLDVQRGEVWLFVFAKLLGTSLVCTVLVELHRYFRRYGVITAGVLVIFQSLLLCHLTFK